MVSLTRWWIRWISQQKPDFRASFVGWRSGHELLFSIRPTLDIDIHPLSLDVGSPNPSLDLWNCDGSRGWGIVLDPQFDIKLEENHSFQVGWWFHPDGKKSAIYCYNSHWVSVSSSHFYGWTYRTFHSGSPNMSGNIEINWPIPCFTMKNTKWFIILTHTPNTSYLTISKSYHYWLVVYLPLWNIWKSMGRMTSHIWRNSKPPTSNDSFY